ncbi:MAG: FAD-dependent oxidoreductase [Dokdonella sp.]
MANESSAKPDAISTASQSAMHPRHEQTFPTLTGSEISRLRRFGSVSRFASGLLLFETGKPAPGMYVLLSGNVAITQRDGLMHVSPVVEQGPGQFLAEVGQLSNRPALVDGRAEGDVEALLITPENVRALLIAEAELGEKIMRALILRRVSLIQSGVGGPVLIGAARSADIVRLEGFLTRNGVPHHVLDPAVDTEAQDIVGRCVPNVSDLPLVICLNGTVLRNPGEVELARALGMVGELKRGQLYDVVVVGCGPAGLSTAVYAASEGLSVAVLDTRAFGGQAGASARIENYLGFPTGISGQALTARAFVQAQKFGAEMLVPLTVRNLDCSRTDGAFKLTTEDDDHIRARAVVVASGARYRRPAIKDLATFEGRGVWYWASPIEARLCAGEEVILVGGGNSAGQAAVFLSVHAAKVRMMVRSDGLAASMSRYLIDRIKATPNIELMLHTEIVTLEGTPETGLQRVRWRDHSSETETTGAIRNVFLFAGADPATSWLDGCGVTLDHAGFIETGAQLVANPDRPTHALESSVAGVFAIGDVRSGSVKRVGAAIGEGAQVVQAVHAYLADNTRPVA